MPLEIISKDREKKTPHLALCHEDQGYSANNRPVSLLMKSTEGFSDEVIKALSNLGYDIQKMFNSEKISLIQAAIEEKYCDDEDDWIYVEDFDETKAIFCMECCLYSVGYTIEDGKAKVEDTATPIIRGVVYTEDTSKPVLLPEAEEEMGEDVYNMVAKALTKPSSKIAELFKVTKKEGEDNLSAGAYAYTPDKTKTSTWKLRIDDATHTSAAVAALGEGFRGNKVEIPSKDLAAVKRKVRAAYSKFFPENEIPEILKSNKKETNILNEEIKKATEAVEALFKAKLDEKETELQKALAKVEELEKGAVLKAREEALSFVTDVEKRGELVNSLAALDEAAFATVVKAMEAASKVQEESELFKQTSVQMTKQAELQGQEAQADFDAMMKAKYGVK